MSDRCPATLGKEGAHCFCAERQVEGIRFMRTCCRCGDSQAVAYTSEAQAFARDWAREDGCATCGAESFGACVCPTDREPAAIRYGCETGRDGRKACRIESEAGDALSPMLNLTPIAIGGIADEFGLRLWADGSRAFRPRNPVRLWWEGTAANA